MGRKGTRVYVDLDSSGVTTVADQEIKAILRAADHLIAVGGRNMLAKILKGSKDKKVLEHGLNKCPVYGFYKALTLEEITKRVDWMIEQGYFEIRYNDRIPVLVYSSRGWEIERETYAEELLHKLASLLEGDDYSFVKELRDRNRGMILLLIKKIKERKNPRFIPLLKAWQAVDYKKVQEELQKAIDVLSQVPTS